MATYLSHMYTLHCRQYYHSHSCLPLVPDEMDVDSESEGAVSQWQKICSQKVSHDIAIGSVSLDLVPSLFHVRYTE